MLSALPSLLAYSGHDSAPVSNRFRSTPSYFMAQDCALMKIVDAKVITYCPGRNFVTLKLVTADGVHGL